MDDLNNITTALASLNPYDLLRVILYGDKFFAKKLIARYQLHLSNLQKTRNVLKNLSFNPKMNLF